MKDFSFWTEYEGASEGSGRSEKIWLMNPDTSQTGLFKMKKDAETTDHISECIAYKLAELLNLSCARFELGTYLNRDISETIWTIQRFFEYSNRNPLYVSMVQIRRSLLTWK